MDETVEWFKWVKGFLGGTDTLVGGFKGEFQHRAFKLIFNHSNKRALLFMVDEKSVPKELAKDIRTHMDLVKKLRRYYLFILVPKEDEE